MNSSKQFWLDIWLEGRVPFHQTAVNSDLSRYWPLLKLPSNATVLVPLCGKSLDMLWLVEQGFHVQGIEISELAVQEFACENKLTMTKEIDNGIISYSTDSISILVADIFQLNSANITIADAIYDRASLIALPAKLRPRYVQSCLQWLKPQGKILLKTINYNNNQIHGPPFCVENDEVNMLYNSCPKVECLRSGLRETKNDHLSAQGLQQVTDTVWLIEH